MPERSPFFPPSIYCRYLRYCWVFHLNLMPMGYTASVPIDHHVSFELMACPCTTVTCPRIYWACQRHAQHQLYRFQFEMMLFRQRGILAVGVGNPPCPPLPKGGKRLPPFVKGERGGFEKVHFNLRLVLGETQSVRFCVALCNVG